jgi:hypothetical protein
MMWLILAFASAALLGCYDTLKKVALKDNAVIPVLFFNTFMFGVMLFHEKNLCAKAFDLALMLLGLLFLFIGSE